MLIILAIQEAEIRRIMDEASLGRKLGSPTPQLIKTGCCGAYLSSQVNRQIIT
jgi:hypothetical protein